MQQLSVSSRSCWTAEQIEVYLKDSRIPMRIACLNQDGFPMICSMWFFYDDGTLWAATHKNSLLVKRLKENNKIAFEIAKNDQPYAGVRGSAQVSLNKELAGEVLTKLTGRYLTSTNQPLADWLLSRVENEYALQINIENISSWDFSSRMN